MLLVTTPRMEKLVVAYVDLNLLIVKLAPLKIVHLALLDELLIPTVTVLVHVNQNSQVVKHVVTQLALNAINQEA